MMVRMERPTATLARRGARGGGGGRGRWAGGGVGGGGAGGGWAGGGGGGGEAGHVQADLGDEDRGGGRSDPGDLIEAGHRVGERGQVGLDLGFDVGDVGGGGVDAGQHLGQQERVVVG